MQTILVAGAGKTSIYLIEYLLGNAQKNKWKVIVADGNATAIESRIKNHPSAVAAVIDITNEKERASLVQQADIVLSLMPPHLHILLAGDCLKYKKNLITSSYISDEMKAMNDAVADAGLMFMCEMGLDPGIDHMTASKIINSIHKVAGRITSFKSYCGGLVVPESDDNPWRYKFSWNPRNIITAGSAGAKYLQNGKQVSVPYLRIFDNNKKIKIPGLNAMAYYPNRDSLKYPSLYNVEDVKTFIRATLRYPVFCKGWQALILLGLTSQSDNIDTIGMTRASWVMRKTKCPDNTPLKKHIAKRLGVMTDDTVMEMLEWTGLFESTPLPEGKYSSADLLLNILLPKWEMTPEDKDMVVMQHEIEYEHKGKFITLISSMVLMGEGGERTAMAKTVGLPMGILAGQILSGKITPPQGVVLPTMQAVYRPVLKELENFGVVFREEVE